MAFTSLALALLLVAASCGEEAQVIRPPCTPGETAVCACEDGRAGRQICAADRTFGECACSGAPDAGPDGTDDLPVGTAPLSSGRYLMAVGIVLDPNPPMFLEATVTVQGTGASTTADFVLQPLKTDHDGQGNPRPDARTPVGTSVSVTNVAIGATDFAFSLGEVTFHGDANPITPGTEVVADLNAIATVLDDHRFCGQVEGELRQPVQTTMDGSTFAAVRHDGSFVDLGTSLLSACPND